ncbi:quinone-dependent dihydroorotate dehydrogenase [Planosporangium thailandense]|uniref:Dihydroorotate dehydrogenase (quinone) n=1 Tax=Planosporangium thailandense TaxID=765197 RepID=A0ABX0Y5R9_9ACTN|nr:quinone-dependent dihydroorotate dehydrogenase [Planosporangium thailandense]
MTLYERVARPVLFRVGGGDAEAAHEATLRWLARLSRFAPARAYSPPGAATTVFGVRFPNPVGLAAGMDKDGRALPAWPALGFGFVEVGTVTWHAQPGNDRPRLYRLPTSRAIVNRMGFNNAGARALAARLAALGPLPVPLGISLGKSKVTPLEEAVADYVASLSALYPYGDYFAVNVSSPNTPGLRTLQDRAHLDALLPALRAVGPKPLLVKVAPDLTDGALGEVLEVCEAHGVAGLIATNTTLSREGVAPADAARAVQAGGLSGAPLTRRARDVVAFVTRETGGRLPVIGVGGVMCPDDAVRLRDAGASLIQVYSGLIYAGPALVRASVRGLSRGRAR